MMKTLKQTSAAVMLALAVLASGCAADEEMTTVTTTDGEDGELMTITVSAGSDATTRVLYDDSKVGSAENDALTWQVNDKIGIVTFGSSGQNRDRAEYTLAAQDAGKTTGSFTGRALSLETYGHYSIVYLNAAMKVNSSGFYVYSPDAQTQAGDGSTAHLKNNLYLTTNSEITDLSNVRLGMQCAIMKFDLKNVPAEVGTLKKLTWTLEGASGNRSMELAFSQNEGEKVTFSSNMRTLTAYLVFDPNNMKVEQNGKFIVILEGDKAYYAKKEIPGGKTYEPSKRYTATIDGNGSMSWEEAMVVQTDVPGGGYSYDGLEMQIGSWASGGSTANSMTLGSAIIADGKAVILANLSPFNDFPIWVCIPKVAKFFHTLTAQEVAAQALTLPDKDGGSILKASTAGGKQYVNDWIVALYMGVNQGGATGADATPIYWATGNLIATKKNAANSGTTTAAFHIATADETRSEATTNYLPTGIIQSASDGYKSCDIGVQWNKFGWGDATGLKVGVNNNEYGPSITTGSISGDAAYDIARAKLGGSWRLPTGGRDTNNELAAFADNSVSGLSPDGMDWTESGYTGRTYTYIAANNITNTLKFPAAGYREATSASEIGTKGFYWSGTLNDSSNGSEFHFSRSEAKRGSTARKFGFSVRPVTE